MFIDISLLTLGMNTADSHNATAPIFKAAQLILQHDEIIKAFSIGCNTVDYGIDIGKQSKRRTTRGPTLSALNLPYSLLRP